MLRVESVILTYDTRDKCLSVHSLKKKRLSDESDGILNSHRTTIIDSFSCILFLRRLYLSLNMHLIFCQFYSKMCRFSTKICSVRHLQLSNVMHEVVLHPSCKIEIPRTGENRGKPCRVCKKCL